MPGWRRKFTSPLGGEARINQNRILFARGNFTSPFGGEARINQNRILFARGNFTSPLGGEARIIQIQTSSRGRGRSLLVTRYLLNSADTRV